MVYQIGINQRIPVSIIEIGMKAALEGCFSNDYAYELASEVYEGANRLKKCIPIINKLTINNPLFDYIVEHRTDVERAMTYKGDRAIIYTAIISAAYPFAYDLVSMMGKYFTIQDQISSKLITERMAAKYGSNRSLPNGLYCILPMLIDAGLITRPKAGVYKKAELEINFPVSKEIYDKSFLVNNTLFTEDYDFSDYPYMAFLYY